MSCRACRNGRSYYGNFDAHHDSGYRRTFADYQATGRFTCEDWTYPHYEAGARSTVRYPRWRDRTVHGSRGRAVTAGLASFLVHVPVAAGRDGRVVLRVGRGHGVAGS